MAIVATYKVALPKEGEFIRTMGIPAPLCVAHKKFTYAELAVNGNVYELFGVPAGTFIERVATSVAIAWTTSVTITIGDGTQAAGFMASADIAPQTAVTTGVLVSSIGAAAEAYVNGRYYAAADTIDATIAGATPAAGELNVWVVYALLQE